MAGATPTHLIVSTSLPVLTTLAALLVYPWLHPVNGSLRSYTKEHGVVNLLKMLSRHPGFTVSPVLLAFVLCPGKPQWADDWLDGPPHVRLWFLPVGAAVIDTAEYWRHRLEHYSRWLYKHAHKEHHQQRPMNTLEGFRNAPLDMVFPSFQFAFLVWLTRPTWYEAVLLSALAMWATYADHTLTGDADVDRRKYHNVHHTTGWDCNLQQPFFTFWDDLCGTRAPGSTGKWNPFLVAPYFKSNFA